MIRKKIKKIVQDADSTVELDKDYAPGRDSLSEGEKNEEEIRSKEVKEKKKVR